MGRRANPSLSVVCTLAFFAQLGVGFTLPILPLYAKSFGVSYSLVGMVISSFGFARLFTDLPVGSLADRVGRRPLMSIGMIVFCVAALVAAFAGNIYHLIVSRSVLGIGAALFATTVMALLGDIAPPGRARRYMSYYQGSFFLGAAVGPFVGGFLAEIAGFQVPFFALAIISVVGAIFAHTNIPETLPRAEQSKSPWMEFGVTLRGTMRNRRILTIGYSAAILFILYAGINLTTIPLYCELVVGLSPIQIGMVLSVVAFSSSLVMLTWSGSMTDRFGTRPMLAVGFAMVGASIYAFTLAPDLFSIFVIAAVFGLATGLINPAQASAVIEQADPEHRGLFVGVYRIFADIGIVSGPLIVGVLSDRFGLVTPFIAVSVVCLLTGAIVYVALDTGEKLGKATWSVNKLAISPGTGNQEIRSSRPKRGTISSQKVQSVDEAQDKSSPPWCFVLK